MLSEIESSCSLADGGLFSTEPSPTGRVIELEND